MSGERRALYAALEEVRAKLDAAMAVTQAEPLRREELTQEAYDALLSLMDRVVGFCSEHARIFP